MEQIKVGDRVKMVSNSTGEDIGIEGILERDVDPDDFPTVIIDGKSHYMTDEGDSYHLVKFDDEYDKGYKIGYGEGYIIGFREGRNQGYDLGLVAGVNNDY